MFSLLNFLFKIYGDKALFYPQVLHNLAKNVGDKLSEVGAFAHKEGISVDYARDAWYELQIHAELVKIISAPIPDWATNGQMTDHIIDEILPKLYKTYSETDEGKANKEFMAYFGLVEKMICS